MDNKEIAILVNKYRGNVWELKKRFESSEGEEKNNLQYAWYKIFDEKSSWVGINAKFSSQPFFPHGYHGIFISNGAVIGKNAVIFQQVTIGSNSLNDSPHKGSPIIGDNVYIGAGAKIIGKVKVGNNCRIGANAVVTCDVPDNSVVVLEHPRIIIKKDMDNKFYNWQNGIYGYHLDGKFVPLVRDTVVNKGGKENDQSNRQRSSTIRGGIEDGTIVFDNLKIQEGRVDISCSYKKDGSDFTENIFYEMSEKFVVGTDELAVALSTLCGQAFKKIVFSFSVTENIVKQIEIFTKAKVATNDSQDIVAVNSNKAEVKTDDSSNIILNFSGGLDSLAAYYLMPENTKLVAIDFGSWFRRERIFFEKFQPYILKTNFREFKLDRFSWTFMGTGAILFSKFLDAKYNVFGTILEASVYPFKKNSNVANSNKTMPFYGCGLYDIRYLNGLTEVGTAIVTTFYGADIIPQALESLAANGSEKRQRKELLLDIVCEKFKRNIEIPKSIEPKVKVKFGKNFALDFLCLYIIKNLGIEAAEKTMCDIPEKVVSFARNHDLLFYERVNTDYVSGITIPDNHLRADFMKKLIQSGVLPYTEKDFKEFREVATLLNEYHHFDPLE